jgi:hypothetical protein
MMLSDPIEVAERRRANLSICPTQSLFPEFDYSGRKFMHSDPGASAGFRPAPTEIRVIFSLNNFNGVTLTQENCSRPRVANIDM